MGTYVERLWQPEDAGGLSRKDRAPGRYLAYIPEPLERQLPQLGADALSAAEDALVVLARADEIVGSRSGFLNHLLIRSESISSSWIEGNRVTPKKLAIAETLRQGSQAALDVVANVRATEQAIAGLSDRAHAITVGDLCELQHVIEPRLKTGLRVEQNWVGGTGWSPLRADFVPPPEDLVPSLMENLAEFVTETAGNPVVRAAIAHAQFETIHPFIDGNGRTGRALIHTVLRRADAVRHTLIPISTVFAGNVNAYISGLNAYRAELSMLDEWIIAFAQATEKAAANAVELAQRVAELDITLLSEFIASRKEAGVVPSRPRKGAVTVKILETLAAEPVLTAESVCARFEVSPAAAHRALTELTDAGVLSRTKDPRGKLLCWTADRYLDLVALTERSNRVGGGDTQGQKVRGGPPAPERK